MKESKTSKKSKTSKRRCKYEQKLESNYNREDGRSCRRRRDGSCGGGGGGCGCGGGEGGEGGEGGDGGGEVRVEIPEDLIHVLHGSNHHN